MIIIKAMALWITMLFVFYRMGLMVNKIVKSNQYLVILLNGLVATTCILQIIYIPLILLHVSFQTVLYLTLIIFATFIIASFFLCKRKEERKLWKQSKIKLKAMEKKNIIIMILLGIMIIAQASVSSLLFNENADDAFYVSLVEENKSANAIYTKDPSLGIENVTFLSRYMVSGHELALSVLSKAFAIPATTLCHTILPFIMIILSYIAYYVLARKFFNNEKAQIFLLLLSILFLFSGFTTMFRGILLLSRIWQGKEIFLNIILTLIISNLISLNSNNKKKKLITLTMLNFSAIFFTNTAIFLVPFAYMGFVILELLKKRWKTIGQLILTGIPVAIYGVIYLMMARNIHGSTYTEVTVIDTLKTYLGIGHYLILYIISLVIIAIKGTDRAKRYFLFIPMIYLITIYNPMFTKIITKYFTGSEVFWRLWWLLPIEFSIAYSFVLIWNLKNTKSYKAMVFLTEVILIIMAGNLVYTKENGFEIAENLYKIPQSIIKQTQYILDSQEESTILKTATVMAPPEPLHSVTMRQLTSKINLFWSRDHYMKEIFSESEIDEMEAIRIIYHNQVPQLEIKEFDQIREKYKVNWIIVQPTNEDIIRYLDQTNQIKKALIEGYILYQY